MNIQESFRDIKMGGIFTADLFSAEDGELIHTYQGQNIILNSGYDYMSKGNRPSEARIIHIGSSDAEPIISDTGLRSPVASKNYFQTSFSQLSDYSWSITAYFESGEANHPTGLREVGAVWQNGTFLNRALFRDNQGNPVVINKTNGQVLRVTLEFRVQRG